MPRIHRIRMGGVFMRKKGRGSLWGWIAVAAGALIVLALILPVWFWWLVCAALLIFGGIWLLKC